nr:hypothetical protein [Tanacetum cinerariifolium]
MGYEKPSTKLTFYKAFFSCQWKFLIHVILQCMSAKRTSWNEFSSSMAFAVICLSTGMIVEQHVDEGATEVNVEDVSTVGVATEGVVSAADDVVPTAGRMITDMDADVDVTLKDVAKDVHDAKINESADVLSMQDDEEEPTEIQEVVEVVTTAKLITEVVTVDSATITAAAPQLTTIAAPTLTTAPSVVRRRKGAVIRNPREIATPSTIIHSEAKSKDKGKGILAGLNKNIDWDEVIDHVQRKQKEDNVVKKYQALKRKPQTEAQARKNMMIYLRNVAGFKMDYFKGMTYDDICPIFKKKFNSNVAFLLKTKEQMDEEDSKALKRLSESQNDKTAKKQKLDKEKCSWSSEGQELEAVRVLWCADYHIYYNIVDFAGREEISTYKVHSGSDAQ